MKRRISRFLSASTFTPYIAIAGAFVAFFLASALTGLLLPSSPYPSRAMCWGYDNTLIYIHAIGNTTIAAEYFIIPGILMWLGMSTGIWKVAGSYPILMVLMGGFILSCGITHIYSRHEVMQSSPWASGVAVWVCAILGALFIFELVRNYGGLKRDLINRVLAKEYIEEYERGRRGNSPSPNSKGGNRDGDIGDSGTTIGIG